MLMPFSYRSCLLSWQERWPFFFTKMQLQALQDPSLRDNDLRLMIFDILSRIPAQLNPNKPAKKMYSDAWPAVETLLKNPNITAAQLERPIKALLVPLFIYSNTCLRAYRNADGSVNMKAAHEKFEDDLCIPLAASATALPANPPLWALPKSSLLASLPYLVRLPEYQASNALLYYLPASQAEHVYVTKTLLSAFLFYLELGASRYSAEQLLRISGYQIDCSNLTRNPNLNDYMQNTLETLLPYAMVLGAHAAHNRAALTQMLKKIIQHFPAYQVSQFFLQQIRLAVRNSHVNKHSWLNHPDSDKYGYSEGAKLILTAGLFYMEMGASSYVPCSLLMMAKQNMDCSQLTRSSTFNSFVQMTLNILLPYAAMLGAYYAASDGGDFSNIAAYAAMSYGFLNAFSWALDFLYKNMETVYYFLHLFSQIPRPFAGILAATYAASEGGGLFNIAAYAAAGYGSLFVLQCLMQFLSKIIMAVTPANHSGPEHQIASYLGQQSVHFTASALFHYLVPPLPWLSAPAPAEAKPYCAENITARKKAAQVLGLDVNADSKAIHARYKQLGREQYVQGLPKDHEKMMAINNAKDCLLEYHHYEAKKFKAS